MKKRGSLLLLAGAALLVMQGCASIEPWVKPYEREHLADPVMSLDPDPVSSAYMDHVGVGQTVPQVPQF